MKIQVLVAAMDQNDYSLIKKMNISTDAIVGNQCTYNSVEEFILDGKCIRYLNFAERGVGLNRNNALMRADADIVLFADDDMIYVDDYEQIIIKAFKRHPQVDVIVFNLREKVPKRRIIQKEGKVGYMSYLRYGTARIAVKLEPIRTNGIFFNQCFGGGTEHCHGEDNLFLNACLKNGMKIVAVPEYIAELIEDRESTWNNGYDEKYLRDQGILYRTLSKRWWRLLCLQDAIRRCKSYGIRWNKAYNYMKEGAKYF